MACPALSDNPPANQSMSPAHDPEDDPFAVSQHLNFTFASLSLSNTLWHLDTVAILICDSRFKRTPLPFALTRRLFLMITLLSKTLSSNPILAICREAVLHVLAAFFNRMQVSTTSVERGFPIGRNQGIVVSAAGCWIGMYVLRPSNGGIYEASNPTMEEPFCDIVPVRGVSYLAWCHTSSFSWELHQMVHTRFDSPETPLT